MTQAQENTTVKVHYTGKLDDGTVFDSSRGRQPFEFELGAGQVISGFEDAVRGMNVGDTKSVRIPPEQAYGPRRPEAVINVARNQFPPDFNPEVGQQLGLRTQSGQEIKAIIVDVQDAHVTVDANHPLAGRTLHFDLELVAVH
jgi:FKBP-type peptidyl-prolyl cis-trans isomerase 2